MTMTDREAVWRAVEQYSYWNAEAGSGKRYLSVNRNSPIYDSQGFCVALNWEDLADQLIAAGRIREWNESRISDISWSWAERTDQLVPEGEEVFLPTEEVWGCAERKRNRETSRDGEDEDGNPISGQEKWDSIKARMAEEGWIGGPVVLQVGTDSKALVDDANHRLAIARELGFETVPVVFDYRVEPLEIREEYAPQAKNYSELPVQAVETGSESVHDSWAYFKIQDGWEYGEEVDDEKKQHPGIQPYEDLDDEWKELDRQAVRATLGALQDAGWTLEPPRAEEASYEVLSAFHALQEAYGDTYQATITVTATQERQLGQLAEFLYGIQLLGGWGSSRVLKLFVDGDGSARLRFQVDGEDIQDVVGELNWLDTDKEEIMAGGID
jgi:hypothetical protein